jgi:hypothetical protein
MEECIMTDKRQVEIAVPPGFDEAKAVEAVAMFAESFADPGLVVEQARERMRAPVQAGPCTDFGIGVAASLAAQILWRLAGPTRDGITRLYEKLTARFTGRYVNIYVRVTRPGGRVITYRLPRGANETIERIELIAEQINTGNQNDLTM